MECNKNNKRSLSQLNESSDEEDFFFDDVDDSDDCDADVIHDQDCDADNENDKDNGSDTDSESDIFPIRMTRIMELSSDEEDSQNSSSKVQGTPTSIKHWDLLTSTITQPHRNFYIGARIPGPNLPTNCNQPIDYFNLLFTDSLVNSGCRRISFVYRPILYKRFFIR